MAKHHRLRSRLIHALRSEKLSNDAMHRLTHELDLLCHSLETKNVKEAMKHTEVLSKVLIEILS